jgi:hypothetical protein
VDDTNLGTRDVPLSVCCYIPIQHSLACMKISIPLSVVITSNIPVNRMFIRRDRKISRFTGRGILKGPNNVEEGDPWNFSVDSV